MSSDLLGISVSGIRVTQTALSTTGHNISNAGVDGYSRQRVDIRTNPATLSGAGYLGNGANVESIQRQVNDFVTQQLQKDTTLFKDLEAYHGYVSQLDNLLSDTSTGLASGLESFFASMQNGLDDPTSIPARQLILSESENLADRFNTLFSRFQTIENNVDEELQSAVANVNALVENVATLNQRISNAMGVANNAIPNDLLDQRDEALRELSELISIQTYDQGTGQVNVVIGSGQNLVVGTEARHLTLEPSAEDQAKMDVVFENGSRGLVVTDLISGGEIGGLVRFRDNTMDRVYNEFGRIAVVMADTFNKTHQQGVTLENEFGGLFFYDVNKPELARARVIGHVENSVSTERQMRLNVKDSNLLKASDYEMQVGRGNLYQIIRKNDGAEVATGVMNGSLPFRIEFDGLELVVDSGTFREGDSFKLQPVRYGGRDFDSALVNASSIAFASPLVTDASIGNSGTGVINPGEILSREDADGNPLPLLANAGVMDPPLIVKFTSPTSYDILDNSDPGHPVQLDPPIRDQRFIVGISNPLFGTDPGSTRISTNGEMIGLPEGQSAAVEATLLPPPLTTGPDFTVTDFSAPANQFSFDVVVSATVDGLYDGTNTVTISSPAITDNTVLLNSINTQLSGSNVTAFIADDGSLAFRMNSSGYGDVTVNGYNPDPDGGGNLAPAGQANNLLGFNVEGGSFTTTANTNGIAGTGFATNGYPAEAITFTKAPEIVGTTPITETIFTGQNASAKAIASQLNNIAGVEANAFTTVNLSNMRVSAVAPFQISLNGENLIEYETDSAGNLIVALNVPDPQTQPDEFKDYLADQIHSNPRLAAMDIHAVAGRNPITGAPELRITSSEGDDLQFGLTAASGESIDLNDGRNPNATLTAIGNGAEVSLTAGGMLDVTLAEDMTLSSFPPNSMLFGDTRAPDFAKSAYLGIQAEISGIPDTNDTFTLDFNQDAASDNRNALALVNLSGSKLLDGDMATYTESYGSLVEDIGIDSSAAQINVDASEQVLHQTTQLRASKSGVNLDEEAANLIRFEQMYSANTQVISVARQLFDRLINAF